MKEGNSKRASDEHLVRLYQGDPDGETGRAAASALFERYWERVYLWCLRRTGRHEVARDIAQDVLISAYQSLRTFEGRCLYSSWVFTIMRNRCLRVLRRSSLVRDELIEVDRLEDPGRSIDSRLIEGEEEDGILELVRDALEPEEQMVLWLRCVEGLPVEEITRRLGIASLSGARGVLQTARRKLRAAMERRATREGRRS